MSHENIEHESSVHTSEAEKVKLVQSREDVQVKLHLGKSVFTDNKISGTIEVTPDTARKLVKKFVLVVDGSKVTTFDREYRRISASGFDPTKQSISISIEAEPLSSGLPLKTSNTQSFSIKPRISYLTPTANIVWPDSASKPNLNIRWHHIGDPAVKQYVVELDDKEVQYIRDPSIADIYTVCIDSFEPDDKSLEHTIHIIARFKDGKKEYRSDPIKFTVPNTKQLITQVITVTELKGRAKQEEDDEEDEETLSQAESNQPKNKPSASLQSQMKPNQRSDVTCTNLSCSCQGPHEHFPGIQHYFEIKVNEPLSSFRRETTTSCCGDKCVRGRRDAYDNKEDMRNNGNDFKCKKQNKDHNDDDDVVTWKSSQ
ncbi:unnamed protein product [Rotaria sp. Silwood1]|nr:unnamed protein product [Rotaria sp. Silwood1]CAF4647229.1 unnamed protein product [Rotaria sp. Silwood1]